MHRTLAVALALGMAISCQGTLVDFDGVQEPMKPGGSDAGTGGDAGRQDPDAGTLEKDSGSSGPSHLACTADNPCSDCAECTDQSQCAEGYFCKPASHDEEACNFDACLADGS